MAGLLEDFSYVQLFFLALIAMFVLMYVYALLTGKYLDIKQQMHGVADQVGMFQFHKRVGWGYFLGIIVMLWMLWNITSTYYFGGAPGHYFQQLNQFLFTPKSQTVDGTSAFIAISVWLLDRMYRYHIAVNVSVFSRRQAYSIFEAVLLYICVILEHLSLLAEAPDFEQQPDLFSLSSLRVQHLLGVGLLIYASKLHGDTHRALTKLRKNRFGHITTTDYKMPKGGWFDVVACPHYFAEILSFVAVGTILCFHSYTWWMVTAFVTLNQFVNALDTHRFYCQKFEDYPRNKKMLIPYLL